jgi:small-conductance mechanosensitive channel/CRP-like cAMP-binding protein
MTVAGEGHRMAELWTMVQMTAGDPMVLALGAIVLGWFAARFLFKQYPLGRALARVALLLLLTVVLLQGGIVPYHPLGSSGTPFRDAVVAGMKIAWWLLAAWLVVGLVRSFIVMERRPREGKLIQDLLAGLVYLAAGFAIVAYVFDLPVQGLLATSGAIAIILGLALQSTLSDVFSGLVLSFSRPYRPDDWVKLEGGTEGRVIEMNWRATHILTAQRDLAIVPNSTIAKSKIVNVSYPIGIHGVTVTVQVDPKTPPATTALILEQAVLNCRPILEEPAPAILVKTINAAYTEFEIAFYVHDLSLSGTAQSELFDLIFRHLAAHDIALSSPPSPNKIPGDQSARKATVGIESLLDLVAIFGPLTRDERSTIASKLKRAAHEPGEVLLEPGTVSQSLFVIGSGVVSIHERSENGSDVERLRLGPADHFGLVSLLTGTAAQVTVTALTQVITFELSKQDLAPILEARPQVAHDICLAVTQRVAAHRSIATTELSHQVPRASLRVWFSDRIHKMFDLDDVAQ